ncbi:hypothetical protein Tco_0481907, partial [Tanacetum coccineum]
HGRSLTELTKDNHVPEVITPNEQNIPHSEDVKGHLGLINIKGTQQQVQNELINSQPAEESSGNNTETLVPITRPSLLEVTQSHIFHHASTSLHPAPRDRCPRDQHIKLLNIIGEPTEGMLTISMATKLIAASASKCLFADFLSKIESKKVSEVFRNMKDELGTVIKNQARLVA